MAGIPSDIMQVFYNHYLYCQKPFMKAIYLTQHGSPQKAFETRETEIPKPDSHQVLIEVAAFGLNFADVLARQGLYKDAPPMPSVLGYEVVGKIAEKGEDVEAWSTGQRVVAFTRFGAYAEYAVADARVMAAIPDNWENGKALALATQYCTAYYAAYESLNLHPEDHVLIHSAAGGVGTALVQLARIKGCTIFGTAGRNEKLDLMKTNGVDYPINYRTTDFGSAIKAETEGEGVDVAFESLGGAYFKKTMKLLGPGGRIVGFGASSRSGSKQNLWNNLKLVWGFGLFSPVQILLKSQAVIGVYMLAIADFKPEKLSRCLKQVVALTEKGDLAPHIGGKFQAADINEAHSFLQSGHSAGKIAVEW